MYLLMILFAVNETMHLLTNLQKKFVVSSLWTLAQTEEWFLSDRQEEGGGHDQTSEVLLGWSM